ncbi:hypothetical protein FNYG_04356 [Fusarium nygamai]|uniref:D-isomer specific 2-hydroxyacid dehydrogenase NAD-binding domain-containing protein n=1 Tax=Gibberella nygamai TaxID=42673 RepID=A0A2K0WIR6_GIBNY|nr:hypothetical protein FNYG_04356 [Fusarium nygamai]
MGSYWPSLHKCFVGGLQADIIAFDPYFHHNEDPWNTISYKCVKTLIELLEVADVVPLHVPLTPSTKNMITA